MVQYSLLNDEGRQPISINKSNSSPLKNISEVTVKHQDNGKDYPLLKKSESDTENFFDNSSCVFEKSDNENLNSFKIPKNTKPRKMTLPDILVSEPKTIFNPTKSEPILKSSLDFDDRYFDLECSAYNSNTSIIPSERKSQMLMTVSQPNLLNDIDLDSQYNLISTGLSHSYRDILDASENDLTLKAFSSLDDMATTSHVNSSLKTEVKEHSCTIKSNGKPYLLHQASLDHIDIIPQSRNRNRSKHKGFHIRRLKKRSSLVKRISGDKSSCSKELKKNNTHLSVALPKMINSWKNSTTNIVRELSEKSPVLQEP